MIESMIERKLERWEKLIPVCEQCNHYFMEAEGVLVCQGCGRVIE